MDITYESFVNEICMEFTSVESESIDFVKAINSDLNKWKYAVLIDGKIITKSKDADWSKYKTIPIKDIEKYHVGVCWDFVNYQHDIFKKNKIKDESYLFVMQQSDDSNDIITHTFSIINMNSAKYWFESSLRKHQGIHKISSYKDVTKILVNDYKTKNSVSYEVYRYNPDGLDNRLSNGEFFKRATKNLVYSNTL